MSTQRILTVSLQTITIPDDPDAEVTTSDATLVTTTLEEALSQEQILCLAKMYGNIVDDVGTRINDYWFFQPYLDDQTLPENVKQALRHWRMYQLQIAAAKDVIAQLRATLATRIEEARLTGVDGKPHKDYKFLGTNKEEQAWSLQLLAPDLFAEIALKEYSLELLEVEARTTKTFLDLYISR